MTLTLSKDNAIDQAVEIAEEYASSAAENLGSLAKRASDVELDRELGAAAERITESAGDLLSDLEDADIADRRVLVGAVVLVAVITLVLVVVANRRRAATDEGDD